MAELASLKAIVHGRVQGVYFRAFVRQRAVALSLSGYVRNRHDGAVEVCAEGERANLEKMVAYLKEGPPHARVDRVETTLAAFSGDYSGFEISY